MNNEGFNNLSDKKADVFEAIRDLNWVPDPGRSVIIAGSHGDDLCPGFFTRPFTPDLGSCNLVIPIFVGCPLVS